MTFRDRMFMKWTFYRVTRFRFDMDSRLVRALMLAMISCLEHERRRDVSVGEAARAICQFRDFCAREGIETVINDPVRSIWRFVTLEVK